MALAARSVKPRATSQRVRRSGLRPLPWSEGEGWGSRRSSIARNPSEGSIAITCLANLTRCSVSRRSPYPGGGELPKRFSHTHDPFVALSFAAAATRTLKLGTGIALMPQRDPIITAKSVASLDQLSGGRFIFAIGGGWNVEEMENHGARYETRFKLLRERVLAMKALWTQEQAEFHGQFVNFDPVWLYPKPKQKPHPPVLLGGESDHTVRRVVEFCDGWFPRARGEFEPKSAAQRLRRAADAAGRDPATLSITVFNAPAAVSTLIIRSGAATPSRVVNFCIRSFYVCKECGPTQP